MNGYKEFSLSSILWLLLCGPSILQPNIVFEYFSKMCLIVWTWPQVQVGEIPEWFIERVHYSQFMLQILMYFPCLVLIRLRGVYEYPLTVLCIYFKFWYHEQVLFLKLVIQMLFNFNSYFINVCKIIYFFKTFIFCIKIKKITSFQNEHCKY